MTDLPVQPPPADSPARAAILDAAEHRFATRGFAATTIKQIGADAEVNPALLYYYFKDKETLYRAVVARLIGGMVDEGMRRVDPALPPDRAVARFVEMQARFLAERPHLPRLLARELADHELARAEEQVARLAATLFARLCDVIRAGQKSGHFDRTLDPRFAAISTIAQVAYLFIARPAVGILLGHGAHDLPDADVDAFARHAARFAVAALRAPADAAAPTRARSPSGKASRP